MTESNNTTPDTKTPLKIFLVLLLLFVSIFISNSISPNASSSTASSSSLEQTSISSSSPQSLETETRKSVPVTTSPSSSSPQEIPTEERKEEKEARHVDADELTLPLYPTKAEKAWKKEYQRQFRKFGVKRRMDFLIWLSQHPKEGIPPWRPGRNKPITCPMSTRTSLTASGKRQSLSSVSIYPGFYSIPPNKMVLRYNPLLKDHDWSNIIPGNKRTYIYRADQEEQYTLNLRESRFVLTWRKGGFQTARNMEIFAAGAIPYFCGIYDAPKKGTVANLPREFLSAMLSFRAVETNCHYRPKHFTRISKFVRSNDPVDSAFNDTLYDILAAMTLTYAHKSLGAEYNARFILSSTSLRVVPKKILIVWTTHPIHPGYLVPTFMIGLKSLRVQQVIDWPRQDIIYRGRDPAEHAACKKKSAKSWGRGFFCFCRVKESAQERAERTEAKIRSALQNREFDAVIFHVPHESYLFEGLSEKNVDRPRLRSFPFFNETVERYPKDKVLFIHDGDLLYNMTRDVAYDAVTPYARYLRRETHGCNEDIWMKRARNFQMYADSPDDDIDDDAE